jgi:predicted metal-binding protein
VNIFYLYTFIKKKRNIKMKIGIIICNRYKSCAGGKCFRAMRNREGAFDIYDPAEALEIVGYTSCGGCPGGNVEYACAEMIKNGAQTIHLATGMVVGYPPCRSVNYFKRFIQEKYKIKVVVGTHPIPQKYYDTHQNLETWRGNMWQELIKPTLADEELRNQYN